jgi:hypothetical protein
MVVYAPGGRVVNFPGDISNTIANRLIWDRDINYFGHWGMKTRLLKDADIAFLEHIRTVKQTSLPYIKIRVEEPYIQFYTETAEQLKDIVKENAKLFKKHIISVTGPTDSNAIDVLNSGAIIKRTGNGYKYKVMIRDGHYSAEVRTQLKNYFDSIDKEYVKITAGLDRYLQPMYSGYMWNSYFYLNDLSIVTFINLISPSFILNIHELVVIADK